MPGMRQGVGVKRWLLGTLLLLVSLLWLWSGWYWTLVASYGNSLSLRDGRVEITLNDRTADQGRWLSFVRAAPPVAPFDWEKEILGYPSTFPREKRWRWKLWVYRDGSCVRLLVPLWTFAAPLAGGVLVSIIRRRYWRRDGHCPACNYDRRGLAPNAACPECGKVLA